MCGAPTVAEHRPFCSRRCADADLARWLSGGYRIPVEDETDAEPEPEADGEGDPDRADP